MGVSRRRKQFERPSVPLPSLEEGDGPQKPSTSPEAAIASPGPSAALLPAAPTPVTDKTPFRASGDVSFEIYRKLHKDAGSRLDDEMLRLMHNAASGISAMISDRERAESSFGTASLPAPNNILGLRNRNGQLDFEAFASPVDCVKELKRRWTDPAYKGGVYLPQDLSISGMIQKYSPPNENDTAALVRACVANINTWRGAVPGENQTLQFGLHPWPFPVRFLDLAPSGRGWDALGARGPEMGITICHHTAGNDNPESVYNLFSRGGGRWGQAATEAVLGQDGSGLIMLDPWDNAKGGLVTPWASGPASSLKGIGVQIVQMLGANAVNKRGFATEHCENGQGFPDRQIASSCKLYGNVITRMGIPYSQFPQNPKLSLRVDAIHNRFAPTECPGPNWPWGEVLHKEWLAGVISEAKLLQTGTSTGGPVVIPDPEPLPDPAFYTAYGLPREQMDLLFGTLTRVNEDGSTQELEFNPEGVLSQLWLQRFGPLGIFPEAEEMHVFDSQLGPGKEWFATWEGGYVAWLPIDNNRAGWRWLDQTPIPVQ